MAERHAFGLLGRRLGHSFSPLIHERLGSVPYDLIELEPDEVAPFVREGDWRGLNVTIPYKRAAAELADARSPRVGRLGVANTLVRRADGSVYADNTDVLGFDWMLRRFCARELGAAAEQALAGEKVLVLGDGGASQAVQEALRATGAHVEVVSRHTENSYARVPERHLDARLVVNATSVGMFPNCPETPLPEGVLARMGRLAGVLDVVYNPCRTGICLAAERLGVPFESGLAMLVAQALHSSALFLGREPDDDLVAPIEREIAAQTKNVVIVGMPGAGKSSAGRNLARLTGRPFVDMDVAIEVDEGASPAQIIRERGEEAFRAAETAACRRYGARSGTVVSCGGGVVTRPENYPLLHQNGTVVLLERDLSQLSVAGRPLSEERGVGRLAQERMPLYRAWADVTLRCTGTAAGDAEAIVGLLGLATREQPAT